MNTLITQGTSAKHRCGFTFNNGPPEGGFQFSIADFAAFKVLDRQFIIQFSDALNHGMPALFSLCFQIGRDFSLTRILAQFIIPEDGFHSHQVNDALEGGFHSYWHLHCNGVGSQTLLDGFDRTLIRSPHPVHLIRKTNSGHTIAVGLAPDCLTLRFHPLNGVEDNHATIQHTQ